MGFIDPFAEAYQFGVDDFNSLNPKHVPGGMIYQSRPTPVQPVTVAADDVVSNDSGSVYSSEDDSEEDTDENDDDSTSTGKRISKRKAEQLSTIQSSKMDVVNDDDTNEDDDAVSTKKKRRGSDVPASDKPRSIQAAMPRSIQAASTAVMSGVPIGQSKNPEALLNAKSKIFPGD